MKQYLSFRSLITLIFSFALALGLLPPIATQAATEPQVIYDDKMAAGWQNYSWATVNMDATAPTRNGSKSIAVTYGPWQGLYLYNPGFTTTGFSALRFYIHGGSAGGQQLQVYMSRVGDQDGKHGPAVQIPPPGANTWTEVRIPLADLGAADTTITGIIWQDRTGGNQPPLNIDDIALVDDSNPNGPTLSAGKLFRYALPADGKTGAVIQARASDPQGPGDIAAVTLDAAALGRGNLALRDDGRSNDGAANDGLYGTLLTVAPGTPSGEYGLVAVAQDQAGNRSSLQLGAFVVLASPDGSVPAGLPQRPAWGSNEWNFEQGKDWQVNSGVPWDYVYQYITHGWEGWGDKFVERFVKQAWEKNYVPVISVYMILGTPEDCGESAACYARKLQNPTTVSTYLASLEEAARQAKGSKTVIFQLEPDFYGFMQQTSNSNDRPAGVRPDDPTSFPVALNIGGYPNDLTGFGRRMIDVIHQTAPNALVAPHASMWATNSDPNDVPANQVADMARRTATFLTAMGGDKADLIFVEWSDRDAGSSQRPWWDDTNRTLPRPSRAVLWESALSAASGKRLILWQVPAGNMNLDNTCGRYKDNRSAYAFNYTRDLFDAGVIAVLYGGGVQCMTSASTDGGFIKEQGAIAYAKPAAPQGLSAGAANGAAVPLRWNDNGEPDLWGYRVSFAPSGGGAPQTVDVGRANATTLTLPRAGAWNITIAAYDAMGQFSAESPPIEVTTSANPSASATSVYMPLVRR